MSIDTLLRAAEYLDRRERGRITSNFFPPFSFFVGKPRQHGGLIHFIYYYDIEMSNRIEIEN